ncbi:beta-ketoacyl synthase N-terminal-like domain-containing protein, partial [Acinetobacter baumannii]
FAGGYIDNPFAFDPSPFGLSPREARQMDPQQRVLLEVAWSACEDAGIPPSSLAGQNVGVFVGASQVDYQNSASNDPAVMESHYMTG